MIVFVSAGNRWMSFVTASFKKQHVSVADFNDTGTLYKTNDSRLKAQLLVYHYIVVLYGAFWLIGT